MVAVVFKADVVVARDEWSVAHLVALLYFSAVHRHFAGAVNSDRQCSCSRTARVHDEICLYTFAHRQEIMYPSRHADYERRL